MKLLHIATVGSLSNDTAKISGNLNLFYAEAGSGPPVVFVHGIPTDYRVWTSQLESLSASFRTISYSRRHAKPNMNEGNILDSTIQENSGDLLSLIEELKLERVHLIGHSFGGFVAMYSAWKHPEKFRSLVLVEPGIPSLLVKNERNPFQVLAFLLRNPSAALSARRFQSRPLKLSLRAFKEGDYDSAVRIFVDGIYEKSGHLERLPPLLQEIARDNAKTVGETGTKFPILTRSDVRRVELPTLLVKGENSPAWLRLIVDILSRTLPNNTMTQIQRSGHMPHVENPVEFNVSVLEFLKRH